MASLQPVDFLHFDGSRNLSLVIYVTVSLPRRCWSPRGGLLCGGGGADVQGAIVIVVVGVCRFIYLNLPPD